MEQVTLKLYSGSCVYYVNIVLIHLILCCVNVIRCAVKSAFSSRMEQVVTLNCYKALVFTMSITFQTNAKTPWFSCILCTLHVIYIKEYNAVF
jgi:hypothetical protein